MLLTATIRSPLWRGFFADIAGFGSGNHRSPLVTEDVIFHLAQNQPLIDEFLEGLGAGDVAEVEEHLVPKAGVEQMQHGMFDAADIEIDRHPVFFLRLVYEGLVVCSDRYNEGSTSRNQPTAAWCWFRAYTSGRHAGT